MFNYNHYERIAQVIKGSPLDPYCNIAEHPCREDLPCPLVERLITLFKEDNPLFDEDKFRKTLI